MESELLPTFMMEKHSKDKIFRELNYNWAMLNTQNWNDPVDNTEKKILLHHLSDKCLQMYLKLAS